MTPEPSDESVLDRARLDALAADLGDAAVVRDVVGSFLSLLPERLADLDHAEGERAVRAAHTLKSTSLLVGAVGLSRTAAEAEAGTGSPAAVREAAVPAARALRRWLAATMQ